MSESQPAEPRIRLFTAARLRANGRSAGQIRTLVRRGTLLPIGRGVYVSQNVAREIAAVPNSAHLLRAAAALALNGRNCVVSHQSAALVHNIDLIGEQPSEVSLTSCAGGRKGRRNGVHRYVRVTPRSHITRKYGLPVTTAARTVIDLAGTLPFAEGVVAADSALREGLTTLAELWSLAAELRGRRGGLQAERVAKFADGMAESALESLARVVFHETGLPAPQAQVTITTADGRFIGRVDFYWRKYKTIAEVDGGLKYENPERARAQLWRDKALRAAGYEVVHFNWTEITTKPDEVAAAIRDAFRARDAGATDPAA